MLTEPMRDSPGVKQIQREADKKGDLGPMRSCRDRQGDQARISWGCFIAGKGLGAGLIATLAFCCIPLQAQNNALPSPPPRPALRLSPGSSIPDANQHMMMQQQEVKKQNSDALNAMRQQEIATDTAKLLILTNDLKARMRLIGDKPLSPMMVREAQVIELLAHDVETKMALTVGGG